MIRSSQVLIAALVACNSFLSPPFTGQESYVDLPFAGVSLVKPEGFEAAKRFDGVENKSAGISIRAELVNTPFADAAKPFQANATVGYGVKVESRVDQNIGGQTGCIIQATQDMPTAQFKKWILIFGDGAKSHMVTANLPLTADEATMNSLKELVLKSKPFAGEKPSPLTDLPYEVSSDKLKPTRGPQKTLVFTKDEVVPIRNADDPVLMVGMSFGSSFPRDPKELVEGRINQDAIQGKGKWKFTTNAEVTVNGLQGREVVTQGADSQGKVRYGYWAVLVSGDDYYLFQGACGVDKAQEHVSSYSAIMRSFKLKESGK